MGRLSSVTTSLAIVFCSDPEFGVAYINFPFTSIGKVVLATCEWLIYLLYFHRSEIIGATPYLLVFFSEAVFKDRANSYSEPRILGLVMPCFPSQVLNFAEFDQQQGLVFLVQEIMISKLLLRI